MFNRHMRPYQPSQREIDLSRVQEELLRLVGISNGATTVSILAACAQEVRLWPLLKWPGALALFGLMSFVIAQVVRLVNHTIAFENDRKGQATDRRLGRVLGGAVVGFAFASSVLALAAIAFAGASLWMGFPSPDSSSEEPRVQGSITTISN